MTTHISIGLNGLIGIGGIAGGILALWPTAFQKAGLNTSMLINSPFTSFLVPGLFLLLVIGVGNLLTSWSTLTKQAESACYQCLLGVIQLLWICLQCLMLLTITPLHLLFLALGLTQIILGKQLATQPNTRLPFQAYQH